ncbi:MAG TPA: prolipoprotein diacylglyceryl transferase [Firmicutes bacterium]|nr:prolipoprotein diacylglyceryl transferase [Bacillota bacterium]
MSQDVFNVTIFGLKDLEINRVAFQIGDFKIYWYGVLIMLGVVLAFVYALLNSKRFGIDNNRMLDVVIVSLPVALICARLYFCIFYGNITEFFNIRSGGLAIYGGIIGAFIAGVIMCKIRKVDVLSMFDLASLGFLIGQAIGRWGNFFNQEAFGSEITWSTWFGMSSENTGGKLVHPCFLYESLWCILGFILLHILSKHRKFKGEIFLSYAAWYGFGRFFIEGLRTDSLMFDIMLGNKLVSIRVSQLVAALSFVIAIVLLVVLFIKNKRGHLPRFLVPDNALAGDGISDKDVSADSSDAAGEGQSNTALDSDESGVPSDSYIDNSAAIGDDLSSAEYNEILDEIRNENIVTDGEYTSESKGDKPLDGISEYNNYDSNISEKSGESPDNDVNN